MKGAREEERGGRVLIRVNYNPTHGSVFSRDPRVTGSLQLAGATQPKCSPTIRAHCVDVWFIGKAFKMGGRELHLLLSVFYQSSISFLIIKEQKIKIKTSVSPPFILQGFLWNIFLLRLHRLLLKFTPLNQTLESESIKGLLIATSVQIFLSHFIFQLALLSLNRKIQVVRLLSPSNEVIVWHDLQLA